MFYKKILKNTLQVSGAIFSNLVMVKYALDVNKKNHEWYSNLPEEKKQEVYERCSEQKVPNYGDFYSGIFHHQQMTSPALLHNTKVRVPYNGKKG